ncbi:MAG TPA: hypothetical protein DDY14_17130 [Chromatiaceae bacterium]|nr:MAG: hypothetical protein N838_00060 [Thiohalocapsa sp. PB-PSB1]HBG97003.1 hypothetical protein [Chromatiaceae bacterium]HCS92584.1 hypothetical protein [Chromatiaceae bacterium]
MGWFFKEIFAGWFFRSEKLSDWLSASPRVCGDGIRAAGRGAELECLGGLPVAMAQAAHDEHATTPACLLATGRAPKTAAKTAFGAG